MNRVRRKLSAGEPVLGHMVLEFFSPGIGLMAANAGMDFIIYDMEHSRCTVEHAAYLLASCRGADITPMVRVPDPGFVPMSRLLDVGARGVMVPRVETRHQAEDIVAQLRYPPTGRRGVAVGLAHDLYKHQGPSYFAEANQDVVAILQIETVRGLENVDAIASTPGCDVIWIGHYDLSVSLGIPGQFEHPHYEQAFATILASCLRHNVVPAYLVSGPAAAEQCLASGFRMLSLNYDIGLFSAALTQMSREVSAIAEARSAQPPA